MEPLLGVQTCQTTKFGSKLIREEGLDEKNRDVHAEKSQETSLYRNAKRYLSLQSTKNQTVSISLFL